MPAHRVPEPVQDHMTGKIHIPCRVTADGGPHAFLADLLRIAPQKIGMMPARVA